MKVRFLALGFLAPVLALLMSCASDDGGIVGSGISTVSGNVSAVESEGGAAAMAGPGVAGIRVRIVEVPNIETETDQYGNFVLSGDFAGSITLEFEAPDMPATLEIGVPAGSTVVLGDVVLRSGMADPQVIRQRDFVGFLAGPPDCAGDGTGTLLVDDQAPRKHQFEVRVRDATQIFRPSGLLLSCTNLKQGWTLDIDGTVHRQRGGPPPSRFIEADTIVVLGRR